MLDQISRVAQCLLREMRVALRRARMQMAEQPLHHVERYTAVDEKAGKRMPQVVQPHVIETGAFANARPWKEQ